MTTGGGQRTAVITGGTRGLGRALVDGFAERGYRVYATGRDETALEALAAETARAGLDVVALRSDVASVDDNAALARRLADDGRDVDVLVHNAALLGTRAMLAEYSPEVFREVMDVNVFGPFDLTRQLRPRLRRGSAVQFITSGVSVGPRVRWGAYQVSKIALDGLAGIWAKELADAGVRIHIIDPGQMRTTMHLTAYPEKDPATLDPPAARVDAIVRLAEDPSLRPSGARVIAAEM